jgi:signal transduction histidine kinase
MGEGDFIRKPDRRLKLLIATQCIWAATLIVLALWWGTLLRQQSDEIANLQAEIGVPTSQVRDRLDRVERMITGESEAFVLIILIANGILLRFFMRDSRRSKSLQAFFASMTHELRTPLTSIKLQAEALRDIEDNPTHTPYINRLLEDVERLEGQVQRALELARIEGGGTLKTQAIPLKNFIQHKIVPQYALADQRIQITTQLGSGFALADSTALNIIFRNILDNAIKYSNSQPTLITIKGEAKDGFYFVEVNHHNSVFQGERDSLGKLFYRGENSQGAGVGLYLIQTLMQKMKGKTEFAPTDESFITHLTFMIDDSAASEGRV